VDLQPAKKTSCFFLLCVTASYRILNYNQASAPQGHCHLHLKGVGREYQIKTVTQMTLVWTQKLSATSSFDYFSQCYVLLILGTLIKTSR
jgi:hypothetical protein